MRPLIFVLLLPSVVARPAAASELFQAKMFVPPQVETLEPVMVGIKGISSEFGVVGSSIDLSGFLITIDLSVFPCPILCEPEIFELKVTLDPLPPGHYTVQAVVDGCVLATRDFEVTGKPAK